jgi:hypothetical protein
MINHAPQDTSAFDRPKARSNPTNERNDTPTPTNRRTDIGDYPIIKIGIIILGISFTGYAVDKSVSNAFGETNEGCLQFKNYVESGGNNNNHIQTNHWSESLAPGVSEGEDQFDAIGPFYMPDCSGLYSECNDIGTLWKFWKDARPENSNTSFNIKFVYNGRTGSSQKNWLIFGFRDLNYTFGNRPIIFQQTNSTDPNAFYPVYDVRRAIAQNEGKVPLEDLAVGTYGPGTMTSDVTPYGDGILTIGTRLLADIKNEEDGLVNLVDYAVLANEWGKSDVNSIADISGPNGIPDKNVDFYDLGAFVDDYLKDIDKPSTW